MECYTEEVWRPVVGYEGIYEVSNLGRLRSLSRRVECRLKGGKTAVKTIQGKLRCQQLTNSGYLFCQLYKGKKEPRLCTIHRLVALAFVLNPENKPEVNHINGNKLDNRAENLEWSTSQENSRHAFEIGSSHRGSQRAFAKLTEDNVREIKTRLKNGEKVTSLAREYRVTLASIQAIRDGRRWTHVL